jgi:magnesium transporter
MWLYIVIGSESVFRKSMSDIFISLEEHIHADRLVALLFLDILIVGIYTNYRIMSKIQEVNMPAIFPEKPWEIFKEVLADDDSEKLKQFLDNLSPAETARGISRLSHQEQQKLLLLLDPEDAADVLEDVPDTQAVDLIEDLPAENAAAIVDEIASDKQADLLGELDREDAEAILSEMSPEESEDVRKLLKFNPDSAGGLMITEYLAYRENVRASEVLNDLRTHRDKYRKFNVQYIYVQDKRGRLVGVLRMHDLLFTEGDALLAVFMIKNPLRVYANAAVDELQQFFDEHKFWGVPVVDSAGRLLGVVLPDAVEEAALKRADRQFLGSRGIVGGEEFRSMPLLTRSGRRFSWLSINIVLNVMAASIIAYYQETLAAAIALAVFLPMISDMSGCSGNQAVAVSLRELTLGLIRPNEFLRVIAKEIALGIFIGLGLGILLGSIALLWKGNIYLSLVVGVALMANTIISVVLGGCLPLILKKAKLDPALVSSPLLTTVTDMCGFFLVLSFGTMVLAKLAEA